MRNSKDKESRKKLEEVLKKEVFFLDSLRKLQGLAFNFNVFARSESIEKLADEMKALEAQIVKRYFFPIDKTIADFATLPPESQEELIKTSEEDREKLLLFIDLLDNEVTKKEGEGTREFKEETKKLREMLISM
ncbi:MAG TPA: hypothetical protein VMW40_00435 [Candidatus Bathyarchaeia archaeon]|nr:hypothetical protein [Candidatus Bathyarchaeia archaeon]